MLEEKDLLEIQFLPLEYQYDIISNLPEEKSKLNGKHLIWTLKSISIKDQERILSILNKYRELTTSS